MFTKCPHTKYIKAFFSFFVLLLVLFTQTLCTNILQKAPDGRCSGAGLQCQPLDRVGQVSHVRLLSLLFDALQGPNRDPSLAVSVFVAEVPQVDGQLAQPVVPQVAVSQQDAEQGEG